jgi:uncharacterized protein (TIGR03437 family)
VSHSGSFVGGQSNSIYTVTVANAMFAGPSNGSVTLAAILPPALSLVSMSGSGWNCAGGVCSRTDALPTGGSYPAITVRVGIAADAPSQVTAQFSLSGGGGFAAGASDLALVTPPPAILAVVNGASFLPGIADGSWVSIVGTNLSATARPWQGGEIIGGKLPTSLDGVSVTIDGLPAALSYISPVQLNAQAPITGKTGPLNVVVSNSTATSSPVTADVRRDAPGLFVFTPGGGKYPAALIARSDGGVDYLGPAGLFGSALTTRPARPGEILQLYATGLGPTNPPVEAGQVFSGGAWTVDSVTAAIGGVNAPVTFAGLVGAGLYQINVTVPDLSPGDQPVVVKANGASSQAGVFVAVGQ